ncbi:MAG: hypothetical protein E4H07_08410 [Nitrosomonadales bacterium]|nr:MAG: hypothetical protein E4H07_08410 [Nitrosomonadales bacterium]
MRKLLVTLILFVANSNAMAKWVEVDTSNRVGLTAYADTTTITKSDNKVEMWVLYDYKTIRTNARKPYMSIRGQWRYDCKEKKEQPIYEILLSENMGRGEVVGKTIYDESVKWLPVLPESVGMVYWRLACGK